MFSHLCTAFAVLAVVCNSCAALSGPFVLWGTNRLQHIRAGALEQLSDKQLHSIYAEAETIVVFVRNASLGPMRAEFYPSCAKLLLEHHWAYLPQRTLTLDPLDFNGNAEIISLVGSAAQQDVEIAALFGDAVNTYGAGKVLGILANDGDALPDGQLNNGQRRVRREAADATAEDASAASTTEEAGSAGSTVSPLDEPMEENFVYIAAGKAMMYTTAPPRLSDGSSTVELREHGLVQADERKDDALVRFIVTFKVTRDGEVQKLILRFRFPIADGYWRLTSVELEEATRAESPRTELFVVGEPPSAPLGFSYKCSSSIQFRHNSTVLSLENIQVQPVLVAQRSFSDAYDCVGFVTGGILSGMFVCTMLLVVLTIAITCILDIKAPTKFENNRGKQLSFSIQE